MWRSRVVNAALAVMQRPHAGAGTRSKLLALFSSSIVDQIVLSAGNFFVGLMLIRRTSDFDYGLFVLVQSTILLMTSAQQAFLSGPVAVMAPRRSPDERRQLVGAVQRSQRLVLRWATVASMLLPVIGYLSGRFNALLATVTAIGALACSMALQREYVRSLLLQYARPNDVLRVDLYYVAALIVGALFAAYGPHPAVLWAVGSLVIASWLCAGAAHRSLAKDPGWVKGNIKDYWAELWPLGLWSGVGAVIYWSFGQSYNYMLASRLNLTAVADVNAARLLLMPGFVIALGVKSLLIPISATWLAEIGFTRLLKRLVVFAVGVVAVDLFYFTFVWFARDWMTNDLLHKTIGDRDVLLMLWACIALIGLVRDVVQCSLIALGLFRPMAWLTALSAVISLGLTWFGLVWWGARAALIGVIAGEVANFIGVLVLMRQQHLLHSKKI